jgi:Zn-dependent peptidase ImmA (M78 family)
MIPADHLVPRERLEELQRLQPDAFSAGTFRCLDGRRFVVYNPLHSRGRTRSNQAHELAHIILDHDVRTIKQVGNLKFLTCDVEQDEEADWLGGCLLLPRELLLKAARKGMAPADIAAKYETSETMARFRLNASGVLVQLGRAQAAGVQRGQR